MARSKKKVARPYYKAPLQSLSAKRRREVSAQFKDDVLAKLVDAFFQVVEIEGWGKRDLAMISGIDETAIGHILSGRRKNVKLETLAVLMMAMRKRAELKLHDLRPRSNRFDTAASALNKIKYSSQDTLKYHQRELRNRTRQKAPSVSQRSHFNEAVCYKVVPGHFFDASGAPSRPNLPA